MGRPRVNSARASHVNEDPVTPPPLPWLQWSPGERVVVRFRLADGLHDALGTLIETAPDHVVIDTRRGQVRVEATTMVTGKKVPPAPSALTFSTKARPSSAPQASDN